MNLVINYSDKSRFEKKKEKKKKTENKNEKNQ